MLNTEAEKVREALLAKGLETPMTASEMNPDQKYNRIKGLLTEVVSTLGLDLTDDSLAETPHRIAKMYVHEIFSGLDYNNFPRSALSTTKCQSMKWSRYRTST